MRVVHVVTRSHRRGAEVAAIELADHLDRRGHDNRLFALALAFDGARDPRLVPLVASARLRPWTLARATWRLRRMLSSEPADIVLAHGGWAAQAVAFGLSERHGRRVWQRILGFPPATWHGLRSKYWSAVARRFAAVVVLDRQLDEEMRRLGFRGRLCTIPNSRDPARFEGVDRAGAANALRAELRVPPDEHLIAFVGHLVDQKQPELAVDVVAAMRERGCLVHLVIAGDGPLRASVEERVAHHDLRSAVTLLGHRDDPEHVYAAAELTLITSKSEGVPGVAIEAVMSGCPVITFPVGSIDEVIESGVTGIVLERPDVSLMASTALQLLRDDDSRREMSAAARRQIGRFSTARTAANYEHLFQQIASPAMARS